MIAFKRILCPTDFSEASLHALPLAVDLARCFAAELLLIHVVQPLSALGSVEFENDVMAYASDLRHDAEVELDRIIARNCAGVRVQKILYQGHPAETILAAAAQHEADLIVIATHGHTGWRRLVFGSVAEAVVRRSSVPVLVATAPSAEQSTEGGTTHAA